MRRSMSVSTVFDHLNAATGGADKFGIRSSALQKLMSVQGQKATPEVAKDLGNVKATLDADVVNAIQAGQQQAQDAVNAAVSTLSTDTSVVRKDKQAADESHTALFNCLGEQKTSLKSLEDEQAVHATAQADKAMQCKAVKGTEPFSAEFVGIKLQCDMTKSNCQAEIAAFKKARDDAMGKISADKASGKKSYDAQVAKCGKATETESAQNLTVVAAQGTFDKKVTECTGYDTAFHESLCNKLAASLQKKCIAFDDYNAVMAKINDNNTDLSHSDRVNEWETSQLTSCILGKYADGVELDGNSVAECQAKAVSYSSTFGDIVDKKSKVNGLITGNHFTCSEKKISFNGIWKTPDDPAAGSALYTKDETASYDVGVDFTQNVIFDVC